MQCRSQTFEEYYIDIILESLEATKHTSWKEIHQMVQSSKEQNECFADLIKHVCKYLGISQTQDDIFQQYIVKTRVSVQVRHPAQPLRYPVEMERKFFELGRPRV